MHDREGGVRVGWDGFDASGVRVAADGKKAPRSWAAIVVARLIRRGQAAEQHGGGGERVAGDDVAACESRGVGILVVDMAFQPESAALLESEVPKSEPLLGEIFGDEAGTGVDKDAANAALGKLL
jgi:hypothetical protein